MSNRIHFSLGPTGHWGFSSFYDVQESISVANNGVLGESAELHVVMEPLRILLVHPGDIRHILATVSRRQRHHGSKSRMARFRPIHFYLLETPIEVLCRDILLLEALNDYEVPIRQRATIFLEVFGNCKVQDRTSEYIEQLGHELRTFLANGSGRLEGILDLSLLKYRDRDDLEAGFKCYSRSTVFDMEAYRDHRMRGFYQERYDSRKNLADWDYHQNLKTRATIIHMKQFKEWRVSGIGFELGDQVYTEPNRTLMSYVDGVVKKGKEKGERKGVLGFWGDIVGGPFFSFGVDSDVPNKFAEGLYEIWNKKTGTEQHRHHTVEIAMYNLFSMLWEIETGTVYRMKKKNDIYSGLGADDLSRQVEKVQPDITDLLITEEDEKGEGKGEVTVETEGGAEGGSDGAVKKPTKDPPTVDEMAAAETAAASKNPVAQAGEDLATAIQRAECIVQTWQNVKVFPMMGNPSSALDKTRFHRLFDAVFVSARAASCVEQDWFAKMLKEGTGVVGIESSKFLVPLSHEQKADFALKEGAFAAKHGWTRLTPPPVFRRRRDENDDADDVLFYRARK